MSNKVHKILVATTNLGKIAELRALLGADVQWLSLSDFEGMAGIEEDGATFAESEGGHRLCKSRYWHKGGA